MLDTNKTVTSYEVFTWPQEGFLAFLMSQYQQQNRHPNIHLQARIVPVLVELLGRLAIDAAAAAGVAHAVEWLGSLERW